jgi:hypothetical protein
LFHQIIAGHLGGGKTGTTAGAELEMPMPKLAAAAFRPLRRPTIVATLALALASLPSLAAAADGVAPHAVSIEGIITHTPVWVWLVLAGLVYLGLKRTQPRDVTLGRMLLMPIVLVGLAIYSVAGSALTPALFGGLAIGAMLGIAAGILQERRSPAIRLADGRMRLPGEWLSLVTVVTVFMLRYVKTVAAAVAPDLAASDGFVLATTGLSAFFTVMLVTRTVIRLAGPAPLAAA